MPKTSSMHKTEHRDIVDRTTLRLIPGPAGTRLLSARHVGRQTDTQTARQRHREPTSSRRCIFPPAAFCQELPGPSRCISPPLHCTMPLHWSTRCIVPAAPSYQAHSLGQSPAPCQPHDFGRAAARNQPLFFVSSRCLPLGPAAQSHRHTDHRA